MLSHMQATGHISANGCCAGKLLQSALPGIAASNSEARNIGGLGVEKCTMGVA